MTLKQPSQCRPSSQSVTCGSPSLHTTVNRQSPDNPGRGSHRVPDQNRPSPLLCEPRELCVRSLPPGWGESRKTACALAHPRSTPAYGLSHEVRMSDTGKGGLAAGTHQRVSLCLCRRTAMERRRIPSPAMRARCQLGMQLGRSPSVSSCFFQRTPPLSHRPLTENQLCRNQGCRNGGHPRNWEAKGLGKT